MSKWIKDGIAVAEPPQGAYGFVYLVTCTSTGIMYVGQKRFWRQVRRKPLKGRKRIRRDLVESDWRQYRTSNKIIQERCEAEGEAAFEWEILHYAETKAMLNYLETWELLDRYVLFDGAYLNGIVQCRIAANQLTGYCVE